MHELIGADAAGRGVRLALPLRAGGSEAEIILEPGHCERLFRTAAYVAIRDGLLDPGEPAIARLLPGRVRDRHDAVRCLDTCRVELTDVRGRLVARLEFPRAVFAAFAAARGVHLLAEAGASLEDPSIAYSLHAVGDDAEAFPVEIPELPRLSVADLRAASVPRGAPADDWVATFLTAEVAAGLGEIERVSRATRVEAAGRIRARVGFDPARRCFVRILERLVIAGTTHATPTSVVSSAASWGDFLATGSTRGPQAFSSVHTHIHDTETSDGGDGVPGDHLLASRDGLRATGDPCISIDDIVTHLTAFPDQLSAALIVSLFPDRRVVTLYGYTPAAQLREEPGYWALDDA